MEQRDQELHVESAGRVVRPWVVLLLGLVLGALAGTVYAGVVLGSHWTSRGRWNRMLSFATTCMAAGAATGLLGGTLLAFDGSRRRPGPRRAPR
jgi:hypothetical protein